MATYNGRHHSCAELHPPFNRRGTAANYSSSESMISAQMVYDQHSTISSGSRYQSVRQPNDWESRSTVTTNSRSQSLGSDLHRIEESRSSLLVMERCRNEDSERAENNRLQMTGQPFAIENGKNMQYSAVPLIQTTGGPAKFVLIMRCSNYEMF